MRIPYLAISLLCFAAAHVGSAYAQSTSAQAEHLFREGRRLMDEGNIAEACGAFDASLANDPAVTTLLNLANCREQNHQYATAWGHFIEAARLTRGRPDQANYNKTATERAAKIEDRLSYLIINVPADALVDGLSITLNGKRVNEAEWNRRFPIDGGDYKIQGKAPGHEPWSTTTTVAAAKDTRSVTVPRFHPTPAADVEALPEVNDSMGGGSMTRRRKAAIAAWAAGAVGIGVGGALELSARATQDKSEQELVDYERQQDLYGAANRKRLLAGVAAGAGAAAVGVGVFLWVTGKPRQRTEVSFMPQVSGSRAALVIVGHF